LVCYLRLIMKILGKRLNKVNDVWLDSVSYVHIILLKYWKWFRASNANRIKNWNKTWNHPISLFCQFYNCKHVKNFCLENNLNAFRYKISIRNCFQTLWGGAQTFARPWKSTKNLESQFLPVQSFLYYPY